MMNHVALAVNNGAALARRGRPGETRADGGPTVSVVICTYSRGRWRELRHAVESVVQQSYTAVETIVVVDHDSSLLERVQVELPAVVAVPNARPRGLSGARNMGLALASGDIVAFLDDDAVAAPDWLELLVQEYADESVLGVGGSIVPVWQRRPRWFPPEFEWVVGCSYLGMPRSRAPVRNLIGANMSFRRALFDQIGGFQSGIGRIGTRPVGCEETDFCIRAARKHVGGVFVYQPLARVRHYVPEQRASWKYFLSRCYAEGLSKSQVAQAAGAGRALATERSYALRTLPLGIVSGIAAVRPRDMTGLARACAISVGLVVTTAGFCVGQAKRALRSASMSRSGAGE